MTKRRFSPSLEAMELRLTLTSGATTAAADVVAPPTQTTPADDSSNTMTVNGTAVTSDFLYTEPEPYEYYASMSTFLLEID